MKKILESGIIMTEEFCTECCEKIQSEVQKQACLDYNHRFITMRSEEEIKKFEEEFKKINKFCYTTNPKENVSIT